MKSWWMVCALALLLGCDEGGNVAGDGGEGGRGGTAGSGGSGGTGGMAGVGGTGGMAGTGGAGGMAGTGGSGGEGACTNEADQAIYEDLTYTDEDGVMYTGTEAASAIGSDCIFGTETSDPVLPGCGDEAFAVVSCFPNCAPSVIQALADCVAMCTQDATGLSTECMACTGDTVACGAAFCTSQCVADTNAPVCIECRCDNGCIQAFDDCSGLPPDGDCSP